MDLFEFGNVGVFEWEWEDCNGEVIEVRLIMIEFILIGLSFVSMDMVN